MECVGEAEATLMTSWSYSTSLGRIAKTCSCGGIQRARTTNVYKVRRVLFQTTKAGLSSQAPCDVSYTTHPGCVVVHQRRSHTRAKYGIMCEDPPLAPGGRIPYKSGPRHALASRPSLPTSVRHQFLQVLLRGGGPFVTPNKTCPLSTSTSWFSPRPLCIKKAGLTC